VSARPDVDALLAGPRGRRLCWELLGAPWLGAVFGVSKPRTAQTIRDAVAEFDRVEFGRDGSAAVMDALTGAVDFAAYWQPPHEEDELLDSPGVVHELKPVAQALLDHPATDWWSRPLALDAQRLPQFFEGPTPPQAPALTPPHERLGAWREDQLRLNEQFRAVLEGRDQLAGRCPGYSPLRVSGDDPAEQFARMSGTWWSTPNRGDVPVTARDLPPIGPVALWLTEDKLNWKQAHCWPVAAVQPPRSYEIDAPQAWADLVARHPLDVTDSRRPDWGRATGSDGPWLIPDWQAVAREYDAVHLSVLGYLTTSGLPVPVGDGHWTLLAGWDPDATFWLTDTLAVTDPAELWAHDDQHEWVRAR